jgi:hypothetical protein
MGQSTFKRAEVEAKIGTEVGVWLRDRRLYDQRVAPPWGKDTVAYGYNGLQKRKRKEEVGKALGWVDFHKFM